MDERERSGGWQRVQRRTRSKSSRVGSQHYVGSDVASRAWKRGDATTFFFTRFPESHNAKSMWQVFSRYGEVVEVIIPNKRDKGGRRFGFARFQNVDDVRLFAIKFDNIFIGSLKLHVNYPRYQWQHVNLINKRSDFAPTLGVKSRASSSRRVERWQGENDQNPWAVKGGVQVVTQGCQGNIVFQPEAETVQCYVVAR